MSRVWLAIGLAVMLLASACGSSESDVVADGGDTASSSNDGSNDEDDAGSSDSSDGDSGDSGDDQPSDDSGDDEPEPEPDPDFSGSDSDDFCGLARELDENDPFDGLTPFDGEAFVDAADETWGRVLDVVPDEIRADVEIIKDSFFAWREVGEKYEWNFFSDEAQAELDALDTAEVDEANERFDAYLEDVCGITSFVTEEEATSGEIDPGQIGVPLEVIADAFGISVETLECLNEEFGGDITSPGAFDPSRMNEEVCGTTLNEVLGLGG